MEDKSKYGKNIITRLKQNIKEGPATTGRIEGAGKNKGGRLLWLDNEVFPGAFYVETALSVPMKNLKPEKEPKSVANPHTHDWDEVLGMFGTDPADPYNLFGEVEFWLGGEKHIITQSCLIYIPAGLEHCPLIYRKVEKPIFNFTTYQGKMYDQSNS